MLASKWPRPRRASAASFSGSASAQQHGGRQSPDPALVQVVEAALQPSGAGTSQRRRDERPEAVEVLVGVVEAEDLGGLGEVVVGNSPYPGSAVAEHDGAVDIAHAPAHGLDLHEQGEALAGLEGGDVGGRAFIPDRRSPRSRGGSG